LRNRPRPLNIAATVSHFTPGVAVLAKNLSELLVASDLEALKKCVELFVNSGVPGELANQVAGLEKMFPALDIVEVASLKGVTVDEVAAVYFTLGGRLELNWLCDQIAALTVENHWQALAITALYDGLYSQQRALAAEVLQMNPGSGSAEKRVEAWLTRNRAQVECCLRVFADIKTSGTIDLAMLSVALREIRGLIHSGEAVIPMPMGPAQGSERTAET
jgi:glutamate dehydrogenase